MMICLTHVHRPLKVILKSLLRGCLVLGLMGHLSAAVQAEMGTNGHAGKSHAAKTQSLVASCQAEGALPSVHCGRTPSIALDDKGTAYVVFSQNGHVYLTKSDDLGQSYTTPLAVNTRPEAIYDDGENRPKIALNGKHVYVSWTHKTPGRYTGDVRFARSVNGGEQFDEPLTINTDKQLIGHRFDTLALDDAGRVYLFWIDKRDKERALAAEQDYPGAAIYVSYSDDQGASFHQEKKWVEHSCECCRIASASDGQGNIALLWRHVFPGNIRDHAIALMNIEAFKGDQAAGPVEPLQATLDDWYLQGCPHQGPDLSFDAQKRAHMVWFTQGKQHKGLVYGQYDLQEQARLKVMTVDASPAASRPQVLVHKDEVFIVWKRFNGKGVDLRLLRSTDLGKTWMSEQQIASTDHDSDYPDLIQQGDKLYVTWHTQAEGLRWMALK